MYLCIASRIDTRIHVSWMYDWQFEFLRPSIAEIVEEYVKVHSDKCPLEEDAADDEDDGEADDEVDDDVDGE